MGIIFESNTYIEKLLKDALTEENIEFSEQYRVYTGGKFSDVKYVGDFFVHNKDIKIIIECDSSTYHSEKNIKRIIRDEWLIQKGYKVLHFSTFQLKFQMDKVIKCIKENLETDDIITLEDKDVYTSPSFNSNDVALFCYYLQKASCVYCVYKYYSLTNNIWSEERSVMINNVPQEEMDTIAIYYALLDLKKNVKIIVFFNGMLNIIKYNTIKNIFHFFRKYKKGNDILKNNKISFKYCRTDSNGRIDKVEGFNTMNEIKSRCLQISNDKYYSFNIKEIEYDKLLK